MAQINIEVPSEFKERVKNECDRRRMTESQLIMMAVEHFLNTQEFQDE